MMTSRPLDPGHSVAIINPASGRGKRKHGLERLPATIEQWITERPGHAKELAEKAVAEGKTWVIAVGGDGTVSEVLNGLRGRSSLAILPGGTGNDLAGHLGIPSIEVGLDVLHTGQPTNIDVGERIDTGEWFANVVGCGFDASVAEAINTRFRWASGTFAYILAVVGTLRSFQARTIQVTVDNESHDFEAMLCSIANTSRYGGGMRIAPNASVRDGLLDIVVVQKVGTVEFLKTFPKVFKGEHVQHPAVRILQGHEIRITSTQPLPVLWDGEVTGVTPFGVRLLPQAQSVLVPASRDSSI